MFQLARIDGLGPIKLRRLLDVFGSASSVLSAKRADLLATPGIGPKLASAILDRTGAADIDQELVEMARAGVRVIFEDDAEYPPSLREIYDSPVFLTIRGEIEPRDRCAIAIVGSRHGTRYGIDQAERFATALAARGITIVSGLARGIDGAAHRGALAVGGRTIAVLASGIGNIYPPEHVELAERVSQQGAVISEARMGGVPLAGLFPLRNRIISGISVGVLVVEAAERSGALSTAHHAVEQNRDVFAIPGRLTDPASRGTNKLIRLGATLVTSPEEILEQLGPIDGLGSASSTTNGSAIVPDDVVPTGLSEPERQIWDAMAGEELPVDLLIERTGLDASTVSASLLTMELRRLAERLPGSLFRRRSSTPAG
ncbi:DNA-processing protein DprA [bacterium]|nr:DNA-processing protein DprA [bacterium]